MIFIIIFLIILLFIPIPIKISLFYKDKDFSLYIFKFKVNLFPKKKKNQKKYSKIKKQKFNNLFKINVKKLLNNLRGNSFKPNFKSYLSLNYSLRDSYNTAMLYGLLHQILPIIAFIFNMFFNYEVKKQNLNPLFKNENYLSFSFKGIITINIAKTIYILFLLIKSLDIGDIKNGFNKSFNRKFNENYNGKS